MASKSRSVATSHGPIQYAKQDGWEPAGASMSYDRSGVADTIASITGVGRTEEEPK